MNKIIILALSLTSLTSLTMQRKPKHVRISSYEQMLINDDHLVMLPSHQELRLRLIQLGFDHFMNKTRFDTQVKGEQIRISTLNTVLHESLKNYEKHVNIALHNNFKQYKKEIL